MTEPVGIPDDIAPIDRMEPHDITAEQAILGACLVDGRTVRGILGQVADADFYRPAHATILRAIRTVHAAGQPVDGITVHAELQAAGVAHRVGGAPYLHDLMAAVTFASYSGAHIARVRSLAKRRALIHAGHDIAQAGYDPARDPDDAAEQAVNLAREVRDQGRAAEDSPVEDVLDFVSVPDEEPDWVLPGYLERGDRVIWTAGEGGGKSVLLRQLAVGAASGIDPFGREASNLGPMRVLFLDCENSARQSRRRMRPLLDVAEKLHRPVKPGQMHIDVRPEGVDLTRADGRAWLMRRVEAVMPDVLIVGPIYRLHAGDPNSEEHARKVTVALDEARLTANCALILEAHAAKANGIGPRGLAPVGSSLWLRWPEFGFGLRPVEDAKSAEEDRARRVIPWRGARDERSWPQFLRQGWSGEWPWRPYTPMDADPYTGRSETGATS